MKCFLGISNFLEEISSLSPSFVLLYFFALITVEGFLISRYYSLEHYIQMDIYFFSPLPFSSLLFTDICKSSSDNHFAFLHFFFLGMFLTTAFCTMSGTSIHSSSGTLSHLILWIYLSLPLYNRKGFYLGHECFSDFPYFLQFKSEFCNKEFMIWATVSSQSCFCWLYRASPSLAAKNIINLISVHLVMCMCRVFSSVVGRECFLWPVHFLGKTLLAFDLLCFVLQGQNCLLFQVSLNFLLLHSSLL